MAWTPEQAQAYAQANPDVFKAFQSGQLNNGDTNLTSAMQAHYDWTGQKEGRSDFSTPASTAASTTTTPVASNVPAGSFPPGYNPMADPFNNPSTYKQYRGAPVSATPEQMAGWGLQGVQQQNGGVSGVTKPAKVNGTPGNAPTAQSNILQRLAQALMARRGTPSQSSLSWDPSIIGKPATMGSSLPSSGNSYYSQLAQMLTQRFGGNGVTSAGQNGLLKNNSIYSNYLK